MKKSEFKNQLEQVLRKSVDGMDWDEKAAFVRKLLVEVDKDQNYDQSNSNKPWTDEELRLVLRASPTRENMLRFAKAFKRGYGSIEQIYRWAGQNERRINEERGDDAFVQRIVRIRKELEWRSIGGHQ